jgi:hypothetical protein
MTVTVKVLNHYCLTYLTFHNSLVEFMDFSPQFNISQEFLTSHDSITYKTNREYQFNYIQDQDINSFFDFHGSNISHNLKNQHKCSMKFNKL